MRTATGAAPATLGCQWQNLASTRPKLKSTVIKSNGEAASTDCADNRVTGGQKTSLKESDPRAGIRKHA